MFDEYKYSYYQTLRVHSRRMVVDALNRRIKTPDDRQSWRGITLASINKEAYEYARKEWAKHYGPTTHEGMPVSWERLYYVYNAKPANFNLAVWQTLGEMKVLQGMAVGKPSRGKTHLTINYIERSYAPPYFKGGVLMPILASAEIYAELLGCQRVLIKDAVDPTQFAKYGYTPYDTYDAPKDGAYISKELNHG